MIESFFTVLEIEIHEIFRERKIQKKSILLL
jgi:hypothetical protein